MKILFTLSLVLFAFIASANSNFEVTNQENSSLEMFIGGDRGRKSKKSRKTNKRRKKKCKQFGRSVYAG